jgi:hypothetical protein
VLLLDTVSDFDVIQPFYRVQDSNVLVHVIETRMYGIPIGHDLELVTTKGQTLQAPTLALKAEIMGTYRDAASARHIAQWIRTNIKELDE